VTLVPRLGEAIIEAQWVAEGRRSCSFSSHGRPGSACTIVVGSLIAPVLVSAAGLSAALVISGAVAVGYGLQLLAGRRHAARRPRQVTVA
jgi:hypothetical protein